MDDAEKTTNAADTTESIHQKRIVHGARFRSLPLNVKCRGRCAFCYESRVSKLLPHVSTEYIPRYDEQRFDAFRQMYAKACSWETETGRQPIYAILPTFEQTAKGISHFPICDIFSTGLTHGQIEEIIKIREGDLCYLYSVGLDIDPDFIAYLTKKFPETFRLHLSIVTFDHDIRKGLMNADIDLDLMRRACAVTKGATFFFILFNQDQLVADVEELVSLTSPENGGLFLHKLYWDKCSPKRVITLAKTAEEHREPAVRRLARTFTGGRPVMCSLGGDIQAYTRRDEIYSLLSSSTGESDEVIFCSPGAFPVVADYCNRVDNTVLPMESVFGGNVDLVQSCTARDVIQQLEALQAGGKKLRRVLLPKAMFWIDAEVDLNGDRASVIKDAFPNLRVDPLEIPVEVICSVVDLGDSLAFFDNSPR